MSKRMPSSPSPPDEPKTPVVDYPGAMMGVLECHRYADYVAKAIDSQRARSRHNVAMVGLALSVIVFAAQSKDGPAAWTDCLTVASIIGIAVLLGLAIAIDWPRNQAVVPPLPALLDYLKSEQYSEAAIQVWLAREYQDKVIPHSQRLMRQLSLLATVQLIALAIEGSLLLALLLSVLYG